MIVRITYSFVWPKHQKKQINKTLLLVKNLPKTNSHCSHPKDRSGTTSRVNIFYQYTLDKVNPDTLDLNLFTE